MPAIVMTARLGHSELLHPLAGSISAFNINFYVYFYKRYNQLLSNDCSFSLVSSMHKLTKKVAGNWLLNLLSTFDVAVLNKASETSL